MMRRYLLNSPQSAARIVALALLADGRLGAREMLALDYLRAYEQLGLSVPQFDAVVDAFRQDFSAGWADSGLVDPHTLAELMGEIDDPTLRCQVLRLCVGVTQSDGRLHASEAAVLNAAVEHWGLHRSMVDLQPFPRPM
jgi:uncharacterized tellurite resistance protein B-like protein